jgi:hypothetical protein
MEQAASSPVVEAGEMRSISMLRLVAAAALIATLAFPACAEPGLEVASLPLGNASSALALGAACVLPAHPAADAGPVTPAPRPAMTLSPRMLEAIRVEADMPAE